MFPQKKHRHRGCAGRVEVKKAWLKVFRAKKIDSAERKKTPQAITRRGASRATPR
jgi:hypothetical protein